MILRSCLVFLLNVLFISSSYSQICQGSLGDPVVNISFGSGSNPGPSLKAQLPNLFYVPVDCPGDGFYTITTNTLNCFGSTWHNVLSDHTPGSSNGYMMLINASLNSGDFYIDTVKGLCGGTTYEFASWVIDVMKPDACGGFGITPNLTFNIESTSGAILGTYTTGNIPHSNSPTWQQYGLFFTMPANANDVVLRITNTAPGGCGNDLALDDITFRPCGPLINASVGSSALLNVCEGDTSTFLLEAAVSAGYNSPAFQWQESTNNGASWKDIAGATAKTYSRKSTAKGTYLYRLTASGSANILVTTCRVASNNITINVNANPTPTAVNDGPKCMGNVTTLTATGGTTYHWTSSNGFSADGASVTISQVVNTAKYYVKVTNNNGCIAIDSTLVTAYTKPVAAMTISNPLCEQREVSFSDISTIAPVNSIASRQWKFGDGSSSNNNNSLHTYTTAGTFTVSLAVLSDKGCRDSITQVITTHPLPVVNFGIPKVCLSDPFAMFTDSTTIAGGNPAALAYNWNFSDPAATISNPNSSALKNPKHSYSSTGIYPVQLTVTSADGCVSTTTRNFTVNGAVPVASFTVDSTSMLCSNQPLVVNNTSTVNFGTITRLDWFWDATNATADTDDNPVPGKKYNHSYPVFGQPATRIYQLKLVAYSGINCVNQLVVPVVLKASPSAQFAALPALCENVNPIVLTQGSDANGLAGTGLYAGQGITGGNTFDPGIAKAGSHVINYTFTASNGCKSETKQSIEVYPVPVVNAGPDRTLLEGGSLQFVATASGENLSYAWSPPIGLSSITALNPSVSLADDQTFILTVTSSDNCSASDDVFVKVLKNLVIPNAFSPNGDGINDTWHIRYLDTYPAADISIFDRYGKLIIAIKSASREWDGKVNGKPVPVGTYYYLVNLHNARSVYKGSVTVIR